MESVMNQSFFAGVNFNDYNEQILDHPYFKHTGAIDANFSQLDNQNSLLNDDLCPEIPEREDPF